MAITLWRRSPAAVNKASYLRLYTGSRLVASLHEHALRAGLGVDEHDLGRLNTRIVKAVHGATRQEDDIATRGSERLVAGEPDGQPILVRDVHPAVARVFEIYIYAAFTLFGTLCAPEA